MARSLRGYGRVSYKEESSPSPGEDTASEDYDAADFPTVSSTAVARHTRPRTRITYTEPDSDVEAISDHAQTFQASPNKRRRLNKASQPKALVTTSRRTAPSSHLEESTSALQSTRRTTRSVIPSSKQYEASKTRSVKRRPRQQIGAPKSTRRHLKPSFIPQTILSDGRIPAWSTLPYEVLTTIFKHASSPLRDPITLQHTPTVSWLIGASRICRAFYEPAMAALYESPPLSRNGEAHMLKDMLSLPEEYKTIPYRTKIKKLEMFARHTLIYSISKRGPFDLPDLMQYIPMVTSIDIIDDVDKPPFRHRGPRTQYTYPDELFASMNAHGVRLKNWRWNGLMFGSSSMQEMGRLHHTGAFATLEHLTVSHVDISIRRSGSKGEPRQLNTQDPSTPQARFVEILSPLTNLKSLSLESINTGDFDDFGQWDWISLLPRHLERFSVINAPYLHSETIESFLVTHGSSLIELNLSHNQLLDLNFLGQLKSSCPKLQVLTMDCQYYSAHELAKDSEPLYDTLLDSDVKPTWPSHLRRIELIHLRKWESDAAVAFFVSLIEAANELLDLRHITVKAMLNIGWRDRAGFRDTWISRMQAVFMDQAPDPDPHLASVRAYREWMNAAPTRSHTHDERSRLGRIMRSQDDDNDAYLEGKFLQGRCSIVDVNVDNLRPTEYQYTEQDFIDSEQSGDEEWRGDSDDGPNRSTRYAW